MVPNSYEGKPSDCESGPHLVASEVPSRAPAAQPTTLARHIGFFPDGNPRWALQLALAANQGKRPMRAPTGPTPLSTEAEVDAYPSQAAYYPVGSFDETPDGNGDPMHK